MCDNGAPPPAEAASAVKPVIALVGRPNVGKSTLFNRLTRSRDAIVADLPGLTRDRRYGGGELDGRPFTVIDTGGLGGGRPAPGLDGETAAQSLRAVEEAHACLFLVDARAGLTPDDSGILDELRRRRKTAHLAVNKTDGMDPDQACAEFASLGLAPAFAVSAAHGRGVKALMNAALDGAAAGDAPEPAADASGIKIAVAGRPNVGKSTLVNRLLGENRVVVFDQPGTTRDSVRIPYERRGRRYVLIDTAGVRRRGKTRETVEKFSVVKALQAIGEADVAVLVADARDGVVEQDLHLLGYAIESGRALVVAVNKWDGMRAEERDRVRSEIGRRLGFADYVDAHFISALHGSGVGELYDSIHRAYESATRELTTGALTRLLQRAVRDHAPPMINGRRIRLRYAHPGGRSPPVIVVHGKQTDRLPGHYRRYLEKAFRRGLELAGTPVRIELRSDENPFTRKERDMAPRQVAQKRRIEKNRRSARR